MTPLETRACPHIIAHPVLAVAVAAVLAGASSLVAIGEGQRMRPGRSWPRSASVATRCAVSGDH